MTPTKDHLLECGWAVLALPYFSEVLTHGKDPCLLLHREGILLPLKRGEPVSPQTVSRLSRNLDEAVRQFHQAPLQDEWAYPFLDGVSLRMRRPSGRQRVHMLVAYGVRGDGTRQLLGFMRSKGEGQNAWEGRLEDLYRRGLK